MQNPKTPRGLRRTHRGGDPDPGHVTQKEFASGKLYSGTSDSGNISEAIEAAILSAKESIPSSFVRWELVKIQGESGGFIDKNSVTVSIHAVAQSA